MKMSRFPESAAGAGVVPSECLDARENPSGTPGGTFSESSRIECTIFEDQCELNPRAVIDALVKQTTLQGAEIHHLRGLLDALKSEHVPPLTFTGDSHGKSNG
jgi:hypothetical protein